MVNKDHPLSIGRTIRHAILFNARNWQSGRPIMDELLQSVNDLFAMLAERNVRYTLVGGIAMLQYVQGRNTEDIDIVISITSLRKLPEITITQKDIFFARGMYRQLQIDFLLTKNPLFAHIQKHHVVELPFAERTIPTATVRGLILLKLYALPSLYRQGDFARVGLYENDIATLMFAYAPPIDDILHELSAFISQPDRDIAQGIVHNLEQRILRFKALRG
ncbi:hypothetical protein [Chloroflexus sp.]|uniref:hypothetical protein n=1 Tax=Chloroflexus sp. TaxID=1904827 RepID=UPI00257B9032|nr:hypothetical protein [Chloroflexus sp.]